VGNKKGVSREGKKKKELTSDEYRGKNKKKQGPSPGLKKEIKVKRQKKKKKGGKSGDN